MEPGSDQPGTGTTSPLASQNNGSTQFSKAFVLLLVVTTAVGFIGIVKDLLLAVLLAAIFSGLLQPVFAWTVRGLGGRRTLAAAVVLLTSILAVGLPLAGLVALVVTEALEVSGTLVPALGRAVSQGIEVGALPEWARNLAEYRSRIASELGNLAGATAGDLVQWLTRATQGTALFVLNLGVMVYAMFFFLRDGPAWLDAAVRYLPLRPAARSAILERGVAITRATVQSIVVVGVIQGLLVGLAFLAAGIPGAAFWGALVVPASAIPGLGAPLVWIPGAVYLLIGGQIGWAIFLAVWGVGVIGVVDNLLRARLVGGTTRMSDLLVFVATLGGIRALGPVGIVVGPVLAGLLLTVLEIYREAFRDVLSDGEEGYADGV